MDDLALEALKDMIKPEMLEEAKKVSEALQARMSPPDSLRLAPLLEKRRWEYSIPDSAFLDQAIYDRCHVWQLAQFTGETFGSGPIIMTEETQARIKGTNPRGVLVSAGPAALDALRSNGVDLGHIVTMIQFSVFRTVQDLRGGHEEHLLIIGASDITSSRDLAEELKTGTKTVEVEVIGDRAYHCVFRDGKPWYGRPRNPRSIEEE